MLDAVPTSLQPKVKAALHTIMNAEHKEAAELAIDQFAATYGAKYPKAVDKVLKDRAVLLAHFAFPAEHWVHLRTTDEIVKRVGVPQVLDNARSSLLRFARSPAAGSSSVFTRVFHFAVRRRYSASAETPAARSC